MPFLLYHRSEEHGTRSFSLVREVELAGRSGPIPLLAQENLVKGNRAWHATASDVVGRIRGGSLAHDLIFDLKPSVPRNVSLYRLVDVWGYCHDVYTPLCLKLECLFSDRHEPEPAGFKRAFDDRQASGTLLTEFLYLNGGVRAHSWTWGITGRVNGALLWNEAFSYFAGVVSGTLSNREGIES